MKPILPPSIQLPPHSRRGSTTVAVLGIIVTVSMVFGAVVTRTMNTRHQVSHVASWQESLLAAEAGADLAEAELRKTIDDKANAFAGWDNKDEKGNILPNGGRRLVCPELVKGGEGNHHLLSTVIIDAPSELVDPSDRQWYRVRATGTAFLPGAARMTGDKLDRTLRQHSFIWDHKLDKAVDRPQTTRRIEVLLKPTSYENAILSVEPLLLNNHQIKTDSYDSRYTATSKNGLYDESIARSNADIATNSNLLDAGNATIKGDAYTNAGTIVDGGGITGSQRDDFYQPPTKVVFEKWTGGYTLINGGGGYPDLVGGSKASPARYKINNLKLTTNPGIKFVAPASTATMMPRPQSYVEVWVPGDIDIQGQGTINVDQFTNVIIYFEGNMRIMGTGELNPNSQPGRLQILGVTPPAIPGTNPVQYETREIYIAGNGIIVAAIYAPYHDVAFGATGSTGTMLGAITGKSIEMGGATVIHYDEALADMGYITDYKTRSWFEDTK
jgi:hypothetical protein